MEAKPTKRAVIDIGRKCNLNCSFCYYHHLGDLAKQKMETKEFLMNKIDAAAKRGNNYIDFTGGEPTIHPDICELVKYALGKGMRSCIITNAIIGENALKKIIDSGVDDFLLSIHGSEEQHNELTGLKDARARQRRFIGQLKNNRVKFRVNCVLSKHSQESWEDIINYIININPYIVNFINMNPHGDWQNDIEGTKNQIADLNIMHNKLAYGINKLEEKSIGVNVRYYPMCKIPEKYRRCVCNDLHVTFDPFEWDYDIQPKEYSKHRMWGVLTSENVELKTEPCIMCGLYFICGGINKCFYRAAGKDSVKPVKFDGDFTDFYHYRKDNELTLVEK